MRYDELKRRADAYDPAFWLDDFMGPRARSLVRLALAFVSFGAFVIGSEAFTPGTSWALVAFYFLLAAFFPLVAFEAYYNSFKYGRDDAGMTIELALLLRGTDSRDLVSGFAASAFGSSVFLRLGLAAEGVASFMSSRAAPLAAQAFALDAERVSLESYAAALYKHDAEFKDLLFRQGVLEDDWNGVVSWLARDIDRSREKGEWWSKRSLAKIQGLGKAWSYGQAWMLEKYGHEAYAAYDLSAIDPNASYHNAEVEELEIILSRASEANALLVADEGSGATDVIARLAKRLSLGMVFPSIEHKRIYVLDTNLLVASKGEKNSFEGELIRLMQHSASVGNVILVIPDLAGFLASARSLGSDALSILDPYLQASNVQVIAVADGTAFHQVLESNPLIAQRFERVLVKGGSNEETMRLLEDTVKRFERGSGLFYTYATLQAIAESADRYIVNGVMPDKAVDLLIESVPAMSASGAATSSSVRMVTKQDIMNIVEAKTGIPVAGVKAEEKDRLTKLEEILHRRIVGQETAVDAISTAMRRARSGVSSPNRPMGSFLFLGPTGVGKTETTKALAEVFFGDEDRVLRLDMSEYSSPDALSRLIGSFEVGKAGTLTSLLRDNPYGVLLLDEFEKANKEVHNLFLQVLDEGIFSDMSGRKVNARNLIIIATSNAGAQTIWDMTQRGESVVAARDQIIDEIIKNGVYKPELLNRFDGVILFHPLAEKHLRKVAALMLGRLKKRLESRRINLKVTDSLVSFLMKAGSDPKFGARPLNRVIQEKVEGVIAEKIIKGELAPGAEVELTEADLS